MQSGVKTREQFQRALNAMALGVTSNYRYWGDDKTPTAWDSARRFWDTAIPR